MNDTQRIFLPPCGSSESGSSGLWPSQAQPSKALCSVLLCFHSHAVTVQGPLRVLFIDVLTFSLLLLFYLSLFPSLLPISVWVVPTHTDSIIVIKNCHFPMLIAAGFLCSQNCRKTHLCCSICQIGAN
jgi:hypothetical protein